MYTCIIIEDDQLNRVLLSHLINKELKDVEILRVFESVEDALAEFDDLCPDLVFLDIELPGRSGLEFLAEANLSKTEVVIVTSHEEYAIKALKLSVIDYLIKPFSKSDLLNAFSKFKEKASIRKQLNRYEVLLQNINQDKKQTHKIGVTQQDAIIFLDIKNIARCEAASNYTIIVMDNAKQIIVSKTLRQFEDLLQPYGFIRVHRSHLVNPEFISKMIKGDALQIEMTDGAVVEVANSNRSEIVSHFIKF